MSFVFKANRFNQINKKDDIDYYIFHKEKEFKKNVAPFNSTVEKKYELEKQNKNENEDQNKIKIILEKEEEEFFKNNKNNKKLSYQFNSKVNRFKKFKKDNFPGPGAYKIKNNFEEKKEFIKIIDNGKNIKENNFPSIPGKNQNYGYTEVNNELILNKQNNNSINTQETTEGWGPGCYEIKSSFDNNKKGYKWHQNYNKKDKYNNLNNGNKINLGPGYYNPNDSFKSSYQFKRSSFFENKIYNDGAKKQLNLPGPGQYYNPVLFSSIKNENKDIKFQIFGSGALRFKEESKNSYYPPPGYYFNNNKNIGEKNTYNRKLKLIPFNNRTKRFIKKDIEIKSKNPGPGYYFKEKENQIEKIKKKDIKKSISFGIKEKRFKEEKKEIIEKNEMEIKEINEKCKNHKSLKPNYFFTSGTKKIPKIEKKDVPNIGAYDLNYYDISKKIMNENYKKVEFLIEKPGFNVGTQRFKEAIPEEKDIIPKEEEEKTIIRPNKKKVPFNNLEKRFNEKKLENNPCPGVYYKDNNWNKKSYNIMFAEI